MDILDLLNNQQGSPRQRRLPPYATHLTGISPRSVPMDRRPDDMRHDAFMPNRFSPNAMQVYGNAASEYGSMPSYTPSPMGTSPHPPANVSYDQMLDASGAGLGGMPMSVGHQMGRTSPPQNQQQAKAFACSTCKKGFARRSDLVRHERIHTGVRPHACTHPGCDKQFIQRSALTVHERVHTGEKPHSCEKCGKPFSDSSSLARHRRIHSGSRPYKCDFPGCQKTFTRRTTLTRHMSHHQGAMGDTRSMALAQRGQLGHLHSSDSFDGDHSDHSRDSSSASSRSRSNPHESSGSISSTVSRTPSYSVGSAHAFFPSGARLTPTPHLAPTIPEHTHLPPSPPRSTSAYEAKHYRSALVSPPASYGGSEGSPPPLGGPVNGPNDGYGYQDARFQGYPGGVFGTSPESLRAQGIYQTPAFDNNYGTAAGVAHW